MLFSNFYSAGIRFSVRKILLRQLLFFAVFSAYFAFADFAECAEDKDGIKIRVISLSPSLTETVFRLGRGDWLVVRSSACNFPPEAEKIAVAGDFGRPSLEKLISLKPDIVIASAMAEPSLKTTLAELDIRFYLLSDKSFDDYYTTVKKLGELLDCRENAEKEIKKVKTLLAKFAAENRSMHKKKPKVYLEIWDRPYMTVGKKSFINDMIEFAGGRNIAADRNEGYFNCSEEWIIKSNPDIIICPAMKKGRKADVLNRNGWQNINAVKNKRVYVDLNDDLIYRLGPRTPEGIKILKKIISGTVSVPAKAVPDSTNQ
jgi:iron complex transport system substrate-binding protein